MKLAGIVVAVLMVCLVTYPGRAQDRELRPGEPVGLKVVDRAVCEVSIDWGQYQVPGKELYLRLTTCWMDNRIFYQFVVSPYDSLAAILQRGAGAATTFVSPQGFMVSLTDHDGKVVKQIPISLWSMVPTYDRSRHPQSLIIDGSIGCAKNEYESLGGYGVSWYLLDEMIPAVTQRAPAETIDLPTLVQEGPASAPVNVLVIADFDLGTWVNNRGGTFGVWTKDPDDEDHYIRASFDSIERSGDQGFGLKISYDIDSETLIYNGLWMNLSFLDAEPYGALQFDVKGDERDGYPNVFKVELKNDYGQVVGIYVDGVSDEWQTFEVPLSRFGVLMSDLNYLTELVFVFENNVVNERTGTIYVDNIRLKK